MATAHVPLLAMWLFLGALLLGSHVWNAVCILLDRRGNKKPRA